MASIPITLGAGIPRPVDKRVSLVTQALQIDPGLRFENREDLTLDSLQTHLRWAENLNLAVLPDTTYNGKGETPFHLFLAYATSSSDEEIVPQLHFDERPPEHRTVASSTYGTGLYMANRREAAIAARRTGDARAGERTIGAFLTESLTSRDILDRRRRLMREVGHLITMVPKELIAPNIVGQEAVARWNADRHDHRDRGVKAILRNQAPRYRAERLQHEDIWRYDLVPPQGALVRVPVTRIGTFTPPVEQPRTIGTAELYGKTFWQAAIHNARDMRRFGVPLL